MNLLGMVIFEGLLIAAAGITFVSGVWGIIIAGGIVSIINLLIHEMTDFWKWEGLLVVGFTFGILVLIGLNYQARKVGAVSGFTGGVLSFVLFGTFITPVLALVLAFLIIGTGFRPRQSPQKLIWGFAPSIWRAILGLGWIILGNSFLS